MVYSKTIAATVLAASVPQALGNLFLTAPVASTTCTANQQCQVAWNDDGAQPPLKDFGPCTVGLFVGSVNQQYLLQDLGSVDVSTTASAQFMPQPAIGANSNAYFIRFTSVNGKDPKNPQYPIQGFSAKFTLAGMTGEFNSTVQGAIDQGAGTGGGNSATGAATGLTSTPAASRSAPTSTGGSPTTTTGGEDATNTSNAAGARASIGSVQNVVAVALVGVSALIASLVL